MVPPTSLVVTPHEWRTRSSVVVTGRALEHGGLPNWVPMPAAQHTACCCGGCGGDTRSGGGRRGHDPGRPVV